MTTLSKGRLSRPVAFAKEKLPPRLRAALEETLRNRGGTAGGTGVPSPLVPASWRRHRNAADRVSIAAPMFLVPCKESDKRILISLQMPNVLAGPVRVQLGPRAHVVLVVESGRLDRGRTLASYTRDWVKARAKVLEGFKELGRRPSELGGLTGTCVTYSYSRLGSHEKSESHFVVRGGTVYELRFAHPAGEFDAQSRLYADIARSLRFE